MQVAGSSFLTAEFRVAGTPNRPSRGLRPLERSMLRTTVALLALCLVAVVAGTAVTGQFWLSLVAMAGTLVLGAAALSLVRMADDEEPDGLADVLPLVPLSRLPRAAVPAKGTGRLERAA
jgi:hypothetical protein